jgi:hypothetical protein
MTPEEKKEKEIKELHIEKIKSFVKGILNDSFARRLFDKRFPKNIPSAKYGSSWSIEKEWDERMKRAEKALAAREEKIKKVIEDANWDSIL